MEGKADHKQALLKSHAFQNVLECFEIGELFKLRYVSKRIGDELVPRCFKKFRYFLPYPEDEADDTRTLYTIIKNASKVEIDNINGSESHLNKIRVIADNIGNQARYLFLTFDGEIDSDDLAKQYVEVLRKFNTIDTLRIDTKSDGNCTKILTEIMKEPNFPWFSSVKTLKCYDGLGIKDKAVLQTFFTRFGSVETFKGIITDYFFPLEQYKPQGKKIRNLFWSLPENAALRQQFVDFLEYNETHFLRLYGGFCDKADVETIHAQSLKHLVLRDMPSVGLTKIFDNLPELSTFHVENVDSFDKENFLKVFNRLEQYLGLEKLVLDLISFDLDEHKETIVKVMGLHRATLRHISFSRNKVTNGFIEYLCSQLSNDNKIEAVDLKYLKETKDTNWVSILKSIAALTHSSKRNITVTLTGYQTYNQSKEIQDYLEKEIPLLELNIQ